MFILKLYPHRFSFPPAGRSIAFKATRPELTRLLGVASLKVVLSDGQLHDGVCLGCARVDLRGKMRADACVPPCALVSCSTSALLEDEWGVVQAVASLSLRLLDLGHSVLPHLIAAPLQQACYLSLHLLPPLLTLQPSCKSIISRRLTARRRHAVTVLRIKIGQVVVELFLCVTGAMSRGCVMLRLDRKLLIWYSPLRFALHQSPALQMRSTCHTALARVRCRRWLLKMSGLYVVQQGRRRNRLLSFCRKHERF